MKKEIVLDNFRLSSVVIDMTGNPTFWNVRGYFITKGEGEEDGRLFSDFVFSSNPDIKQLGGAYFRPSEKVHNLTELLMSEIHTDVEKNIWKEFGGSGAKRSEPGNEGESGQQEERQEVSTG